MIFDSDMPAPSKLVAAYLRTHMNDYRDFAFPSVPTIAEKTSQSQRTVQGHLRGLCEAGYLAENGHSQHGTKIYKIVLPPQELHPATDAPPQEMHPAGAAPPQEMPERGAGAAPEVTKETNTTTTKGKGSMKRPPLAEVIQHCREKGYTFDPIRFHAYYESNGWKVGRTPMKDWRSACVTWQSKENENGRDAGSGSGRNTASDRRSKGARLRDEFFDGNF